LDVSQERQLKNKNMLTFAFAFVFHMVAGMNPCTDNSKFTGELVHNEQKCEAVAGLITSFTPSLATCQETVASLGGSSRFEILGMMRVCCQNSATLCDPFRPATTTAAPHATGMTCIPDFEGSYELGGRSIAIIALAPRWNNLVMATSCARA